MNWISVKDELPPEEEDSVSARCLIRTHLNQIYLGLVFYDSEFPDDPLEEYCWFVEVVGGDDYPSNSITHWMPLPDPPKEKKE